MARTEYWKKVLVPAIGIDPGKVSFAAVYVEDDNTVRMSYELAARSMLLDGFVKVGEPDGS